MFDAFITAPPGALMTLFSSFAAFEAHVNTLGLFHMDLRLERMDRVLTCLGHTRPQGMTLQVLGTNGKGSTSSMLEGLARAQGRRTGVFSSPHFVSLRERVRIDGALLDEQQWLRAANSVAKCAPELTYFEWMTAVALELFALHDVDVLILEAGLGGRHDATTAVAVDGTVVTPIGEDHENILGPGLKRIAADKAGAFRPGVPVFSARQSAEVRNVLEDAAEKCHSPLRFVPADPPCDVPSCLAERLPGTHQQDNFRLATLAWSACAKQLGAEISPAILRRGAQLAWLPGRLQWCRLGGLEVLLDGAHNPPALECLRQFVEALEAPPRQLIFSCLSDKATAGLLEQIRQFNMDAVWVPEIAAGPRNLPARQLASQVGGTPVATLGHALQWAQEAGGRVLICGSLYLLAEFFRLHPRFLVPPTSDLSA